MNLVASNRWLTAITGYRAVLFAIIAVAVPTFAVAFFQGDLSESSAIPFAPFVVLSAIFLAWRYAAAVAVASATLLDALFIGPPNHLLEASGDVVAVSALLVASALVMGVVHAARKAVASRQAAAAELHPQGIVFSLSEGQAWASWYGHPEPVHLGPQEEVAEMMNDFLAQVELGKRLARKTPR